MPVTVDKKPAKYYEYEWTLWDMVNKNTTTMCSGIIWMSEMDCWDYNFILVPNQPILIHRSYRCKVNNKQMLHGKINLNERIN